MPHPYLKYAFHEHTGYLVDPRHHARHDGVAIGHTARVTPWSDEHVHIHEASEEYFILLAGKLIFLVGESLLTLQANELLMVRRQVPHAIVGGDGRIEHFGLRAPARNDKQVVGRIPPQLPALNLERERTLRREWGYRIPLAAAANQNCWLLGVSAARFESPHLALAFLNFPTAVSTTIDPDRHRPHLHRQSWEYYTVLRGVKTLQLGDELVTVSAGEMLEVPPQLKHRLIGRQAPFRGFTFRAPVLADKVEY
jgi:mannose-6-phosphate isomerase-like protein (cupin superfamily)